VAADHTIGWTFTLLNPVTVTHLGVWDHQGNGTAQTHETAIWELSGSTPVLQATVTAGSSVLGPDGANYWRWVALTTPVTLQRGQYVIGSLYQFDAGGMDDYRVGRPGFPLTAQYSADVVFGENRRLGGSTLVKPTYSDSDWNEGRFGPNFLYTPVPEPALLQLPFLVGLAGFGLWWRRRNTDRMAASE